MVLQPHQRGALHLAAVEVDVPPGLAMRHRGLRPALLGTGRHRLGAPGHIGVVALQVGPDRQPLGRLFQPLDLLLVALGLLQRRQILADQLLPRLGEGGAVGPHPVAAQDDGAVGDPVEELAVMRHQEEGQAQMLGQPALQPHHLADVEMVGRLVQDQQVRVGQRRPRHQQQALPAAGQRGDFLLVPQLGLDPQLVQHHVGAPGLVVPRRLGQGRHQRLVQGQGQQLGRHRLRHMADQEAAPARDAAAVQLDLAEQRLDQRRLAAAVVADQADPVVGMDGEAGILEQGPAADLEGDGFGLEEHDGTSRLTAAIGPGRVSDARSGKDERS